MRNQMPKFVFNSFHFSLIYFSAVLLFQFAPAQLTGQDFDPTKVKGDLQKIKEPLAELIKLKTKGGKLSADFIKDRQTAYTQVNKINSIGGNRGGGSSSSGSNWEIRMNSNSFEGYCNFGYSRVYPNPSPNTWKLKLKEKKQPNRDLFLEAGPNGEVSITLYGGDNAYLLRIRQFKSGTIFVQEVSDTDIFSETATSFDVFCRRHSKFTQDRLLPMIRHLGIGAPMTQFDKTVQQSVISFLTPIAEEQLTSFQTSFKNLDSSDYDKRKADSDKLAKGFKNWHDFVLRAVNDNDFSFEVRFRLMEALEKNGKPEEIKASRYAISADLANNPQYLVWLYETHEDESTRANILNQLRQATGEDLGSQIAAWKKKYETSSVVTAKTNSQPPVDLLAEEGGIDSVRDYVGQLVRLHVVDNKIQLDRDHWSEQFGGKSIQKLVTETNETLEKLNMPANYDPDPLFQLSSVSHPQAIFAKMRSKMQATRKSSSVYYYSYNRTSSSSLNRQFNNNDITVSMEFEPTTTSARTVTTKNLKNVKPPVLKGKPFKLDLGELKAARRSLMIQEKPDGQLRVALVTEKSNAFVQLLQKANGQFIVQDVRGPEIFTAKGATFTEFFKANQQYCEQKLFPLFSHLGISFKTELYKAPPRPKKKSSEKSQDKSSTKKSETTRPTIKRGVIKAQIAIPRGR